MAGVRDCFRRALPRRDASGAGVSDRAIELALEAAAIGRRLEVPDLEMLGLALEGATLVACAHVDEGRKESLSSLV